MPLKLKENVEDIQTGGDNASLTFAFARLPSSIGLGSVSDRVSVRVSATDHSVPVLSR